MYFYSESLLKLQKGVVISGRSYLRRAAKWTGVPYHDRGTSELSTGNARLGGGGGFEREDLLPTEQEKM